MYTGRGGFPIENLSDIQRLSVGLSGLFFEKDPKVQKETAGVSEIYVFSTPFDRELPAGLRAYGDKRVTVFTTAFPSDGEEDAYSFSVMKNGGLFHIPGAWALRHADRTVRRTSPPPSVSAFHKKVEIKLL